MAAPLPLHARARVGMAPRRQVEMDSVREYVSQSDKVLELHNEIQGCDAILARMQEVGSRFVSRISHCVGQCVNKVMACAQTLGECLESMRAKR
jgi:Vps52 / Sac2 family